MDSNGFDWVWLGYIGFYWVLLGFTGFYWVILGFPGFWLRFTGFERVVVGFNGFYWVLLGFTFFYRVFTRIHWVSVGFSGFRGFSRGFCWVWLGFHCAWLGLTAFYRILAPRSTTGSWRVFRGFSWVGRVFFLPLRESVRLLFDRLGPLKATRWSCPRPADTPHRSTQSLQKTQKKEFHQQWIFRSSWWEAQIISFSTLNSPPFLFFSLSLSLHFYLRVFFPNWAHSQ